MRQGVIRFVYRNKWLVAAVVFEVLGLIAAFGAIPNTGLPTAWFLAATGILSCTGVVIVTVYFMYQYNRRPLNTFQKDEIARLLLEYTPSKELSDTFVQKSLKDFAVFWIWRYQKSVMEFAWASRQIDSRHGDVLVATLHAEGSLIQEVRHAVLPPPFCNLGPPLSDGGETLPSSSYSDWGDIFRSGQTVVLYRASDFKIRLLRVDGSQKVVFSEELALPVLLSSGAETPMPQLVAFNDAEGNPSWQWKTPALNQG